MRAADALAAAIDAAEPKRRLLRMLGVIQTMLAECRADTARSAKATRRELAAQPVVTPADWRHTRAAL